VIAQKGAKGAKPAKGAKVAKNQKPTPTKPSPSVAPSAVAQKPAASPPPNAPQPSSPAVAANQPPPPPPATSGKPAAKASGTYAPEVALAGPVATPVRAVPVDPNAADTAGTLASTAGGGNWKTFPPGRMPIGRLIATSDLHEVADRGTVGERIYLKGQFVVNFADANRAVLRPRGTLTDSVLHFGSGSSTRIIVEFPSGYTPPPQGAVVNRDEARPFEITEVRKQEDGQLNVFAREIMQP
jgi:hypothetical protein